MSCGAHGDSVEEPTAASSAGTQLACRILCPRAWRYHSLTVAAQTEFPSLGRRAYGDSLLLTLAVPAAFR
jgi:hypothetical protein